MTISILFILYKKISQDIIISRYATIFETVQENLGGRDYRPDF